MILDSARNRLVLFGGEDESSTRNDAWTLNLNGTPTWSELIPEGFPPDPRTGHVALYDAIRDRMLVFGGSRHEYPDTTLADLWELSFSPTPTWTKLIPFGSGPSPHFGMGSAYDLVRDRWVFFGGASGISLGQYPLQTDNDLWALSLAPLPSWVRLDATEVVPRGRFGNGVVYDSAHDRLLSVHGGTGLYGSDALPEVWSFRFDVGTPALVSLVDARWQEDRVILSWLAVGDVDGSFEVERRLQGREWTVLGPARSTGGGLLEFEDATTPGPGTYGYRLAYFDGPSRVFTAEATVVVPGSSFALLLPHPHPVRGALVIPVSLETQGDVTLEIFDASGRLRLRHRERTLGPGPHEISMEGSEALASGSYWVRLSQGNRSVARRVVFLR